MSEYTEVELPFLQQLAAQGWTVIDQGFATIPQDPAASLRTSFREWLLPSVFDAAVRRINTLPNGAPWLTDRQLDDLRSQLLRQPNRTLLEANEAIQALLFKAQVDVNEATGEADPVVKLIDFAHPENNTFHAINQFRIDTPGCVRAFIIPDIVLLVNGIPLCVVECKKGSETCANPMAEAFVQLQRYMGKRLETAAAGLREGEPKLFHSNLLLIRSCGLEADYGTLTSGEEHFYDWKTLYPQDDGAMEGMNAQQRLVAGMLMPATLLHMLRTTTLMHGHRQWPAHQGGVPLPAVPGGGAHHGAAAHRGYTLGAQRRGVAHAGFGQVADHGFFGPHAARQQRPERLQNCAGERPARPRAAARWHRHADWRQGARDRHPRRTAPPAGHRQL